LIEVALITSAIKIKPNLNFIWAELSYGDKAPAR